MVLLGLIGGIEYMRLGSIKNSAELGVKELKS